MDQRSADAHAVQILELVGKQTLTIERREHENILQIMSPDAKVRLSIQVTESGPVLYFEGANLKIKASGDLAIEAQRIGLFGQNGIGIASGGDVDILAQGNLQTRATIQNITSTLGNVNVQANDDVCLVGERIRVNC